MQHTNVFVIAGILALTSLFTQIPLAPVRQTTIAANQSDFIRVTSAAPYIVPAGKKFMLTSLGSVFSGSTTVTLVSVNFDSELVGKTYISLNSTFEPSMTVWPRGLVATENQVVQVTAADQAGIALGILTDM